MKTAFLALAAMTLAPIAAAADIEITYSPEFQEKLQDALNK